MNSASSTIFKSQTLGVISNKSAWQDAEGIKTQGGFGRQLEEYARCFDRLILCTPFEKRDGVSPGYTIRCDNLEIAALPYYSGTGLRGKLDFLWKLPGIARQVGQVHRRCSLLQYRLPGYTGITGVLIHKLRRDRPGFIWLSTDWPGRIRSSGDTPPRRVMAAAAALLLKLLIHGMTTFALGDLAERYRGAGPFLHPTISSVLSENDILATPVINAGVDLRVLYVGRLAREKGLPHLLEAIALCLKSGLPIELTLVGDGEQRADLVNLTRRLKIETKVHFAGYIPLGEALWRIYRQSDLFILPSLSEAQGKVLVEAMASGVAIIATGVGGIPRLIQHNHNGWLVEAGSAQAIFAAILRLAQDSELRRRLTVQALACARSYTIETHTAALLEQLTGDLQTQGWLK